MSGGWRKCDEQDAVGAHRISGYGDIVAIEGVK